MSRSRARRWGWAAVAAFVAAFFLAQPLALAAIDGYQRWISPRKGWRCARAVHLAGPSCSQFGEQSIAQHGLAGGLLLLRQRLRECRTAQLTLHRLHATNGVWNCASDDCSACNLDGTWSCN